MRIRIAQLLARLAHSIGGGSMIYTSKEIRVTGPIMLASEARCIVEGVVIQGNVFN